VARDSDSNHEDERPPSPSIYESDIGKTETFFRGSSSSSSNRDCRAPSCDIKLPGRTLSQSYRQVVDDFPVDDCSKINDHQQLSESIGRPDQGLLAIRESIARANPSIDQASEQKKDKHRIYLANRGKQRRRRHSHSFLNIGLGFSSISRFYPRGITSKLKTRLSSLQGTGP